MKWWFISIALFFALAGVMLFAKSRPNGHEVIYKVYGPASSDFVQIKYLVTPLYDDPATVRFKPQQLGIARVAASALPWSTTTRLPEKALTWLWASNEKGRKSRLKISVIVDGEEFVTEPVPPATTESIDKFRVVGEGCCD